MDVSEVVNLYRQRSDDGVFPFHASDEILVGFAAEAEEEACIRARLIYDETSTICTIPVLVGVSRYQIDPCIFDIQHVRYINQDGAVFCTDQVGAGEMIAADQSVLGRPYKYAHVADDALSIWPVPNTYHAGSLKLSVYRTPLFPVEELDDPFEIHERWHRYLVDWLLYRVYSSKDIELRDDERAAEAYKRFEQRFGIRRPADIMRRHREKRPVTVRYGGL